jgi:hypothetical protein
MVDQVRDYGYTVTIKEGCYSCWTRMMMFYVIEISDDGPEPWWQMTDRGRGRTE